MGNYVLRKENSEAMERAPPFPQEKKDHLGRRDVVGEDSSWWWIGGFCWPESGLNSWTQAQQVGLARSAESGNV